MQYEIVQATDKMRLQRYVNTKLQGGWKLIGGPFVASGGFWFQAMTISDHSVQNGAMLELLNNATH